MKIAEPALTKIAFDAAANYTDLGDPNRCDISAAFDDVPYAFYIQGPCERTVRECAGVIARALRDAGFRASEGDTVTTDVGSDCYVWV